MKNYIDVYKDQTFVFFFLTDEIKLDWQMLRKCMWLLCWGKWTLVSVVAWDIFLNEW